MKAYALRAITEGDATYIRTHEGAICRVDDRATALVMAAGPDLLAAVKAALPLLVRLGDYIGNVDDSSNGTGIDRCSVILAARDAIDKAEGGSEASSSQSRISDHWDETMFPRSPHDVARRIADAIRELDRMDAGLGPSVPGPRVLRGRGPRITAETLRFNPIDI